MSIKSHIFKRMRYVLKHKGPSYINNNKNKKAASGSQKNTADNKTTKNGFRVLKAKMTLNANNIIRQIFIAIKSVL